LRLAGAGWQHHADARPGAVSKLQGAAF